MIEQFLNHIDKHKLCLRSDPVLLAVSGGLDSVVMLYLFRQAGFNVGVAHCNFQLRDKESDGDEQFVAAVCNEFDIPLFIRRFETEAYAWEKTLSIQIAARDLRYAWFKELISRNAYSYLATAHHFDDSIETIVLNVSRGTGVEGLAGIPVKNDYVIRPLLFASRKQIEQYAIAKGLVWREDSSNQTDNYQRNFIRHNIIPRLQELNPSLESTWRTGLMKVQSELAIVQQVYEEWKQKFVIADNDRITIDKHAFELYPDNPVFLWRYCRTLGFNFDQVNDTVQCLHGQSGKRFMSPTHMLVIDRKEIIISKHSPDWMETTIEEGQLDSYLGPWTMRIENGSGRIDGPDKMKAVLDGAQLKFPLTWRKWRPGDYFHPLGMQHRKKLSDFFIDLKMSVTDKEQATVLESDGKIVWVAGHRIDERFKLTESTKSTLSFCLGRL